MGTVGEPGLSRDGSGIPVYDRSLKDLRTRKQWLAAGRRPKDGIAGVEMYPGLAASYLCGPIDEYWPVEDTEPLVFGNGPHEILGGF